MSLFSESPEALQSLVHDDGSGAILAAASGDVAGGVVIGGYSAVTQVATVTTYHVMVNGAVDRSKLADELLVLDGKSPGTKTYRRPSPAFREWLDAGHAGDVTASADRSSEPATRMSGLGLWFRQDPDGLVAAATAVGRLTHLDASSVAMGVAAAAAVAGSSHAMSGSDLLHGVAETVEVALHGMEAFEFRFSGMVEARAVPEHLRDLSRLISGDPTEMVRALSTDNGPEGLDRAMLGIGLGASMSAGAIRMIELAAMSGGSDVGAITGAIVGARVGLGRWPWRVPNETWFAEIGRRAAVQNGEVRDLPVPYAIEERFNLSPEMSGVLEFG